MSNSSTVLRRIFNDARPLVEQALDLSDKFKGFRELATANGLDWSQIKALLKAQIQDEREDDGKNRVGRIIEKADFATAYADMLGLGTAKMNENNFSSELHKRHDGAVVSVEAVMADLPPHDEDGVIIEPASAPSDAEAGQGDEVERQRPVGLALKSSSVAPPSIPDVPATGPATAPAPGAGGITPAKGDAGEMGAASVVVPVAASSINSDPQGCASEEGAAIALNASSSQIKSNAKATEVEPGNAGGTVPVRHNNDRAGVASRLAGGRTPDSEEGGSCALGASPSSHPLSPSGELTATGTNGGDHEDEVATAILKSSDNRQVLDEPSGADPGSAVESGAQISEVAAIAPASAAIAPVELSPSRDVAPGAPHSSDPGLSRARDGRPTKQETGDPKGSEAASAEMSLPGKSPDPIAPIPGPVDEWADLEIPTRFDRRRISEAAA